MSRAAPDIHTLQIPDAEFVVCDVETTGLSPERNRLTEIALLRVRAGEIVDRFNTLVNPGQFVSAEITRLTGITNDMVYEAPGVEEVLPRVQEFIGDAVFVGHNVRFDRSFLEMTLRRAGAKSLDVPNLCTARLARRLIPKKGGKSLGTVAAHFQLRIRKRHRAAGDAEATARILLKFFRILEEEFDLTDVGELLTFQNRPVYRITGPPPGLLRLKSALAEIPHQSGVYVFRDKRDVIIYIGKARDLRDRVLSYFYHNIGHTDKVRRLVKAVHSVSWETTETELSALLTEARLIKKHQPRFNSMLKNDRKYPFIRVDVKNDFPTIAWCYELADDGAEYFGPFRSRYAVEEALDAIDRLFWIRECDGSLKPDNTKTPCLYYDIKRCAAPCSVLQNREEYAKEVEDVFRFLRGDHDDVLKATRERMEAKAESMDFEGAGLLRDRIEAIEKIVRQQRFMVHSIRRQNIVIVTPARGRNVELQFIKGGMLASTMLVDQRTIPEKKLEKISRQVYHDGQEKLFDDGREDINEMRIIASWSLTRRHESVVIDADSFESVASLLESVASLLERIITAIREAGQ